MQPLRHNRKWIRRCLISVLAVSLAWAALSFVAVSLLTRRAGPEYTERVPSVPWASFEAVRLDTQDHEQLGAWFHLGKPGRPVAILMHGNGADRSACIPQARLAIEEGWSVLLVTARAHGDSSGTFNDIGYSARRDILAAHAYVIHRLPDSRIILWGGSLGAAAAVFATAEFELPIAGLVLECPYPDLTTAVRRRLEIYLPNPIAIVAGLGMRGAAACIIPDFDKISPETAIARLPRPIPVLILAGSEDRRAAPDDAERILKNVPHSSTARLVVIRNGAHLDLESANPTDYRAAIRNFLRKISE